jgi:LysM repeat protein
LNTQKQILLIVVLFFTFVGGCAAYSIIELPLRAPDQATWTKDQSIERGALLFANNCRTCHGIQGQGGVGLPLNKPEFQNQDPLVLKANRALLQTTIYCGRAGTRMPSWLNTNGGSLNARQIEHIIDLITQPVSPNYTDEAGNPTSKGWTEAVEFAHNLNRETNAIVGGDNLDGIAKQHLIGYAELAAANKVPLTGALPAGTKLHIPGFKTMPDGYTYTVYKDNETITKVADSQHVGAVQLADLNGFPYKFTESKGKTTFVLLDDKGAEVPGLFPGTTLKLPATAAHVVSPGETLDGIAAQHGLSTSAIKDLNSGVLAAQNYTDSSKLIEADNKLKLPNGTVAVVQPGQTAGVIAATHGMKLDDFLKLNNLAPETVPGAGQKLKLPDDTRYTVQAGDTLQSIAAAHAMSADELAKANSLKAGDSVSATVTLKLPPVDKFLVKGQTLEDVGKGYSSASGPLAAKDLADANGVKPNDILRVGTKLNIPPSAWGSTPPDTINSGTACVEHAVSANAFKNLLPGGAAASVTPPAAASTDVKVEAHANDFTVTADGTAQPINKGVVLIAKGKSISFTNLEGLHTITVNGKNTGSGVDFKKGDTRNVPFPDAGQFKITCEVHPDMLANVFVQ